jgi:hypothetical protein
LINSNGSVGFKRFHTTCSVARIALLYKSRIIIYISTSLDIDKSYFLKIHPETDISGVCGEISETTEKICYISILIDGYMYR